MPYFLCILHSISNATYDTNNDSRLLAGDIPKKFQLTADELDVVEGCDNFETQKRLLDQIVIDRDLPVAMRTFQVGSEN